MADREKTAKKLNRIAVFTNGWGCEFISMVMEGLRKEAAADGVDIFAFVTYHLPGGINSPTRNQFQLHRLFDPEKFDGIIVFANTFNTPMETDFIHELIATSGLPAVSTAVPMEGCAFIGTANYNGAYELAKHIIEVHGCRNIVYVSGYEGNDESAVRRQALADALAEHGLSIQETIYCNFDFYMADLGIDKWIKEGKPLPDAFVCANDHMALGVISAIHNNGMEVPDNVIVTGYDHILDGQFTHPSIASVSRCMEELGINAYLELLNQIEHRDPSREIIFESHFVPSESCGCPPSEATINLRLKKMRNYYAETNQAGMVDFFFQEIRIAMAQAENKEQFHRIAEETLGKRHFFGTDYCICTEPRFFELEETINRDGTLHFHKTMDVLYEQRNGKPAPLREFSSAELYPGYVREPGRSNFYILSAMYGNNVSIGYIAIKNYPSVMYDLHFKRWINNMESMLVTVRQYIFSQKVNRQLREIYMNDFLTGMYNRTGCEDILYTYIESRRDAGLNTVLLFADINFMKEINDGYGHLNGDLAIKATAKALRNSLPESWLFGRYGGDEFIAVGPCNSDDINIEIYRANFAESLKKIADRLQVNFDLSASLGYCVITAGDSGYIGDFIRIADMSMYEEKKRMHEAHDNKD